MGTWGTGITSNDTFADIYGEFIDLYNEGFTVSEITEKLIAKNQETIDTPEEANNFWFALAKGQWECQSLDEIIFDRVEKIILTGIDIAVWKDLDASPADIKAREKVLFKFLEKLKTPKNKPRKRVKKKLHDSIFKKGDCLTYIMDNGNYGGAFVLTDELQTVLGINYIAITTIDKPIKPTIDDFKTAEVYVNRVKEISFRQSVLKENWVDQPQIGGFYATVKNNDVEIEVIGQLPIYKNYKIDRESCYGWKTLKSAIPNREKYTELNGQAKSKLKLSKWTKRFWI